MDPLVKSGYQFTMAGPRSPRGADVHGSRPSIVPESRRIRSARLSGIRYFATNTDRSSMRWRKDVCDRYAEKAHPSASK